MDQPAPREDLLIIHTWNYANPTRRLIQLSDAQVQYYIHMIQLPSKSVTFEHVRFEKNM